MKKLLLIAPLLAALLTGCPSTPIKEAPVEERKANQNVQTVNVEEQKVTGLPMDLTNPKSVLYQRVVYFDLDKYEVRDEFKNLVAAHAKFLVGNRSYKMLVQGHTDERGTSEYNLSLGQKRAEAVKRNLILLGAQEDQIEAVSLGKEKPAAEGRTEEAWAKNRRAHMLYKGTAGSGEF